MTHPSSFSVGANNIFTAPLDTTLTVGTTCYIDTTGAAQDMEQTDSDNEDSGAAAGWSIADGCHWERSDSNTWNSPTIESIHIRVNGSVNTGTMPTTPMPATDTTALTLTGAVTSASTLTLTFNEALNTNGNKPATSAFTISGA